MDNTVCGGCLAEREPVSTKGLEKHWEKSSLYFTESQLVSFIHLFPSPSPDSNSKIKLSQREME